MTIPSIMWKLKMQVSKQINILNNTQGTTNQQYNYYDIYIRNTTDYMGYVLPSPQQPKLIETERLCKGLLRQAYGE